MQKEDEQLRPRGEGTLREGNVQQLLPQTRPHEAAVELSAREAVRKRNVSELLHQQLQPEAEGGGKGGQTQRPLPRLRAPQQHQRRRNFVIFRSHNYFYASILPKLAISLDLKYISFSSHPNHLLYFE